MGEWAIVIVHCFFGSWLQIWSFRNRLVCYFCMLPARLEEEGGQEKRKEKKEKERRGKKNARDEGKMTQKKEKKVEEGEKPRGIAKSPISSRFFLFPHKERGSKVPFSRTTTPLHKGGGGVRGRKVRFSASWAEYFSDLSPHHPPSGTCPF